MEQCNGRKVEIQESTEQQKIRKYIRQITERGEDLRLLHNCSGFRHITGIVKAESRKTHNMTCLMHLWFLIRPTESVIQHPLIGELCYSSFESGLISENC